MTARIERLAPEQKQTLQKASVLGRVFQERVLRHLHEPASQSRFEHLLLELQRREFVQAQQQQAFEARALENGDYIFKHAITHDVAYHSMLLAKRKPLHALAARALENLYPDRLEELAATLGYHFERAEARREAAHYLGRAAERAQATFANAEALVFYRSALTQLERIDHGKQDVNTRRTGAHLHEGLGDVLTLTGDHVEASSSKDWIQSQPATALRGDRARL
ncbi:MAG: hypothetical protein M3505_10555 [Verrucomicrobiota bacterium]|nr:hypothetical protein [Verrucomicrobiota bacterium]